MDAYKIYVLPAASELGEVLSIEGETPLAPFEFSELIFTPEAPLRFAFQVIPANEGVVVVGEVKAALTTSCVRCLEVAKLEVISPFEEEYYFDEKFDEEGEPYPLIDDEGYIDVSEQLFESLLLGIPFAPLCTKDCEGLCTKCGTNLNLEDCGCGDELDQNHPFANIASLISDKES